MRIKEVLVYQQTSGHFLLICKGLFFRGYNESACLLSKAMGYMIKSKDIKSCGCKDFPREYKFTLGQDVKRDAMQLVRHIYRDNS